MTVGEKLRDLPTSGFYSENLQHVPWTDSASKLYYISPEILQQIQVWIALYSGNVWIRNFTREDFYIWVYTLELLILFFELVRRRFSHHGKRSLCRNGQFHDSLWLVGITDHFLAINVFTVAWHITASLQFNIKLKLVWVWSWL